jgi:CrcB protein
MPRTSTVLGMFERMVQEMTSITTMAFVFMGGAIGTLLRWGIGLLVGERYTGAFPLGTFVINVTGAFVMGLLSTISSIDWQDRYGSAFTALVLTGILGGYTTFSSYELDSATVYNKKERALAFVYWAGSVAAGLAAAGLGWWVATLVR